MTLYRIPVLAIAIALATLLVSASVTSPFAAPALRGLPALPVFFEPTPQEGVFTSRRAGLRLDLEPGRAQVHLARGAERGSLALTLEGAAARRARPEQLLPGVTNYFVGDDPGAWRAAVPHYARVRYEQVYPGIDLVYHGAAGELEYDFEVAPGAQPGHIRMRYAGADSVRIDAAGNLVLAVRGGEVVHRRPVTFQVIDGVRHEVASAFRLERDADAALVSFELGDYDASLPLTIDPVLSYATYLGGSNNNESVSSIVVDAAGAAYLAGFTNSTDFPVTGGAFQATKGAVFDVFVAKLNPAGTALEYATYLGGSGTDLALALRVDAGGNAFVAGETFSANFPVTAGAAQAIPGGSGDLFVAKLNATGGALLYSTYLGGSGGEPASTQLGGFAIDSAGNAYVYADTDSANYPVSAGAPQPTRGNPNTLQFDEDLVLTRLNAAGTAFTFSTYLGGTGIDSTFDHSEEGRALAIDDAGSAWLLGTSESTDFPTSAGAFDTTFGGPAGGNPGGGDMVVARYDTAAGTRTYATFLGGSGDEHGTALAVDAAGNAYVAGQTQSANFPTTAGAPDATYGGGSSGDVAIAKLNPTGSALVYGTYLGGGLQESPAVVRVDSTGALFIAGETRSPDFPATAGAADTTHNGGFDGFITKLNATGTGLSYSTFTGSSGDEAIFLMLVDAAGSAYAVLNDDTGDAVVTSGGRAYVDAYDDYFIKVHPAGTSFLDASYVGGTLDDYSTAMALDAQQNLWLAGITASSNYPATAGAFQTVKAGAAGSEDVFIAKFATTPATPVVQPGVLAFGAATYGVGEAAGTATVTVTRSGGANGAVSATCTAASGGADTATAGADYTAGAVMVSWADGDAASKTCGVPVANDALVESAETFSVTLSAPTGGATLGTPVAASVTITDDDVAPVPQPGTVALNPASYSVNENGGSVTLTLTRTNGADGAISVSVTSGGGSASAGTDYTALSQVVSWAGGDAASKTVQLAVLDDAVDETNETVNVMLSAPSGGATLGATQATVTIVDDDVTPAPPLPPPPPAQSANVSGKYGKGALDAVFVGVLALLVLVRSIARRPRVAHAPARDARAALLPMLALLAIAALVSPAHADGWYAGVRGGLARTTQTAADLESALAARGHDVGVSLDERHPSATLFAGYLFAPGLALEAGLVDLGEYSAEVTGTSANPPALPGDTLRAMADGGRGLSAALAWRFRLGERLELTPRVGAYYWESKQTVRSAAGALTDHEYGVDLMGGITLAWKLDERWSLGVGWESWAAGSRNDVRVVNAALTYTFGD